MNSLSGLISRLGRGQGADRRLDADVVATVLAPAGCIVDPMRTVDGWDILFAPDDNGETTYWQEAADVPRITGSLGEAMSFVEEVCGSDASLLLVQVLRSAMPIDAQAEAIVLRLARVLVCEAIRHVASQEARRCEAEAA